MHNPLLDFGVPCAVFLLMLISGTEIPVSNLFVGKGYRGPITLGLVIQLILIPLLTFALLKLINPEPRIACGLFLLTLCPGGGISNYYTYRAQCDVVLSATITSLGTLLSLLTLPLGLLCLQSFYNLEELVPTLPVRNMLSSLIFFVLLPLCLGCALNYKNSRLVSKIKTETQVVSLSLIFFILFWNSVYFYDVLSPLIFSILFQAISFILGSMFVAWTLTTQISAPQRPVLIFESAVRNVGIALILGKTLFGPEVVGVLTSFLIVYFVIEICIMLTYAHFVRAGSFTYDVHAK